MRKKLLLLLVLLLIPFIAYAEDGKLVIENIQDTQEILDYEYAIEIEGIKGAVRVNIDGKNEYVVFDAQGKATINVKSNSIITIQALPVTASYSLEVKPVTDYDVVITASDTLSYNGIILEDTRLTIRSNKIEQDKPVIAEEKDVKVNPRTSDDIALIGLICLFAMLFLYTLLKYKTNKYE